MTPSPTSADFFETMYLEREDPWQFASSAYERDRYAATLRALSNRRFRRAFEPGCSIGILCGSLPENVPSGEFDLLVFSEIGYYFNETQLRSVAADLVRRMETGGTFLAVHWLGFSADHVLDGDRVHGVLETTANLRNVQSERYSGFRLDRWSVT